MHWAAELYPMVQPRADATKPRVRNGLRSARWNTSTLLARLRTNKRPIVLTQHGRSAAIVLDVEEYESLLDKIALLQDIHVAEEQIARGEQLSQEEAVGDLRSRLAT